MILRNEIKYAAIVNPSSEVRRIHPNWGYGIRINGRLKLLEIDLLED